MWAKVMDEQAPGLSAGGRTRVSWAWLPDVKGGGKLAPQAAGRIPVRRLLTGPQRELIHGHSGDERAGTLEAGEVLPEQGWAHLRGDGRGLTVSFPGDDDPPFRNPGAFTPERFTVTAGGGRQVKVTEVTVTVRLVPQGGVSDEDVKLAKARLLDNVDVVANYQHRLNEAQFHYRIVFTDDPAAAQQTVELYPGDGLGHGQAITASRFYVDMPGPAWAQQSLIWLGLRARYPDPVAVDRKQAASPGVRYGSAVMSVNGVWWADGSFLRLRPGVGEGPLGVGLFYGLKDEDLDRVDGLIGQAEADAARDGAARVAEVPGTARVREPHQAGEVTFRVAGLPRLADVQVPRRVTGMLELFPEQERTLELALLLDWGRALPGRAPADAGEAWYAVRLVLLAGDVYGGIAFRADDRVVDPRLMSLVRFFGRVTEDAVPDRYLPDLGELRRLVAGLLGLPASVEVTAAEVDAAARVVDQYVQEMGGRAGLGGGDCGRPGGVRPAQSAAAAGTGQPPGAGIRRAAAVRGRAGPYS